MRQAPAYVDPVDGSTYPIDAPRWRSSAGRPLMISDGPGLGRDEIEAGVRSLWRYAAALPIAVPEPVTLGEGTTPLVERSFGGGRALFNLEWFAPTGSFKDRGASVMVSVLRQQGIKRILEDSSGNGGSAIAAYAAAAGIGAKIVAPASRRQLTLYASRSICTFLAHTFSCTRYSIFLRKSCAALPSHLLPLAHSLSQLRQSDPRTRRFHTDLRDVEIPQKKLKR